MNKPLGKEINELARDIRKFLNIYLDEYSLGEGQFGILYDVQKEEGISQEKLSTLRNVDKATITKAVKKLIDNGYIYRERDESDRRAYKLYCTPKGMSTKEFIEELIGKENQLLLQGNTPEEMAVFLKVIKTMKSNINEVIVKESGNE